MPPTAFLMPMLGGAMKGAAGTAGMKVAALSLSAWGTAVSHLSVESHHDHADHDHFDHEDHDHLDHEHGDHDHGGEEHEVHEHDEPEHEQEVEHEHEPEDNDEVGGEGDMDTEETAAEVLEAAHGGSAAGSSLSPRRFSGLPSARTPSGRTSSSRPAAESDGGGSAVEDIIKSVAAAAAVASTTSRLVESRSRELGLSTRLASREGGLPPQPQQPMWVVQRKDCENHRRERNQNRRQRWDRSVGDPLHLQMMDVF
eukprot:TRINITY_DN15280_c0_g1_i1.p1 TRINITY_DN15280_c0_g1~~TRINITY_DN15280_c0_g1_i1.p1  ORF type:complete len:255 (+),score=45.18 TRINITY_DN15280_c0_g1_i1:113-877(+)